MAVEDFAVLFEFWKEGEATEEEAKEAYQKALDKIEEAEFKRRLTNRKMNCRPYCRSTVVPVVLKARIGQKCLLVCTACMAKNKAGQ